MRQLADEFTRAFQRTQWGVNGRVEPRFFADAFVFRDLVKAQHDTPTAAWASCICALI